MSTEHNHSSDEFVEPSTASRYDLLLAGIPMPLLTGALLGTATPAPFVGCLAASGVGSVLLLAYGLFVDAPV
jgi:hypothetical protein